MDELSPQLQQPAVDRLPQLPSQESPKGSLFAQKFFGVVTFVWGLAFYLFPAVTAFFDLSVYRPIFTIFLTFLCGLILSGLGLLIFKGKVVGKKILYAVALLLLVYIGHTIFISPVLADAYRTEGWMLVINSSQNYADYKKYIPVSFTDSLSVRSLELMHSRNEQPRFRSLGSTTTVSISESFRIIYSYSSSSYFVNMHVDRSVPGQFENDRLKVLSTYLKNPRYTLKSQDGVEYIEGVDDSLMASIPAVATVFYPQDEIMVTFYFLNEAVPRKNFQTIDEFLTLKDRFLENYFRFAPKASAPLSITLQ
jgi:hypothetical protein